MICFSIKLETEWFDFFSRMLFVRVLSKEYHVIADELNNLVNLVDFLWIIFMIRCLSFLNSMSDIANKKQKNLVHTITFNIIVFNQQK